jgi:hypothetical protein
MDELADLRVRLERALGELETMVAVAAARGHEPERQRLSAKAQGIKLAMSYIDEMLRAAAQ